MLNTHKQAEELRKAALAKVRGEEYDEALALYDEAAALATDEETRELITINKADAMIAMGQDGAEVHALPTILMRRRNLHHAFMAAYALMFKHRLQNDTKRGIFYGQLALNIAIEADESSWKVGALNDLGIIYETDSQFDKAIDCLEQALELVGKVADNDERTFVQNAIVQNLGYNKLLVGETETGLFLLHSVIDKVQAPTTLADAYIDLCYGYLDLEDYERARYYGSIGLELAAETRQVRNAHYLLGEAAYKSGDTEAAEHHFDELCKFYPQFRNLKSLLFAIDLRGMVNLKL
ncbi:MAG TPA: tetratricopeptide repeat protein [Thermoanaerobaculia bacterium]